MKGIKFYHMTQLYYQDSNYKTPIKIRDILTISSGSIQTLIDLKTKSLYIYIYIYDNNVYIFKNVLMKDYNFNNCFPFYIFSL